MSNEILIHSYTSLTLNSSSFFLCSSRNSLADNDGGVGVTPPPPLPPPPLAAAAEVSRGAGPSRSFNLRGNVRQEEEEKGRVYTADYSREHWTRTCTVRTCWRWVLHKGKQVLNDSFNVQCFIVVYSMYTDTDKCTHTHIHTHTHTHTNTHTDMHAQTHKKYSHSVPCTSMCGRHTVYIAELIYF